MSGVDGKGGVEAHDPRPDRGRGRGPRSRFRTLALTPHPRPDTTPSTSAPADDRRPNHRIGEFEVSARVRRSGTTHSRRNYEFEIKVPDRGRGSGPRSRFRAE